MTLFGERRIALAAILAALIAFSMPAAPAAAQDNTSVAVNEEDGASVFEFAFDVVHVVDGIVDQTNAAVAYSSCEACTTVAVAIQIVLVIGDATVVQPQNVAVAVNYECTLCETFAVAYQFVVGVAEGPIHFTGEGRSVLADIYKEIKKLWKELEKGDVTVQDFLSALDGYMDEVRYILQNEIVPAGPPGDEDDADDEDEEPSPSPTSSPTPSADASPTEEPSADPSPSEPGSTPTPEATP